MGRPSFLIGNELHLTLRFVSMPTQAICVPARIHDGTIRAGLVMTVRVDTVEAALGVVGGTRVRRRPLYCRVIRNALPKGRPYHELAAHGASIYYYVQAATDRLGFKGYIETDEVEALAVAVAAWLPKGS